VQRIVWGWSSENGFIFCQVMGSPPPNKNIVFRPGWTFVVPACGTREIYLILNVPTAKIKLNIREVWFTVTEKDFRAVLERLAHLGIENVKELFSIIARETQTPDRVCRPPPKYDGGQKPPRQGGVQVNQDVRVWA
jgi:hypothetical protein